MKTAVRSALNALAAAGAFLALPASLNWMGWALLLVVGDSDEHQAPAREAGSLGLLTLAFLAALSLFYFVLTFALRRLGWLSFGRLLGFGWLVGVPFFVGALAFSNYLFWAHHFETMAFIVVVPLAFLIGHPCGALVWWGLRPRARLYAADG
jgi:hypothetical protein